MSTPPVRAKTSAFSDDQCRRLQTHLEEVLRSSAFSGSHRSQEFLRYVVKEALEGRGHALKERNIAIDVFGRGEDFDPESESIVRVSALEVRKRLAHFYYEAGSSDVQIELLVGNYRPTFHFAPAEPSGSRAVFLPPPAPRVSRRTVVVLAGMISIAAGLLLWRGFHQPPAPLDLLWQPFAVQDRPVLISLPAPTVYELKHPDNWLPIQPGKMIPATELREMETYYVGVGAGLGAARFAEQLALRHEYFLVKFGQDVSFSDLRHSPTILLGAYTSPWTRELTQKLRFRFEENDATQAIVDSATPGRRWEVPVVERSSEIREGYALLTRLLHSESGNLLLIAAGISARDTQAAVEFLTNPEYFATFARVAPKDWPNKNFQVVIHNFVHGTSPGRPGLVAWHLW